jgi:hypothetical protein
MGWVESVEKRAFGREEGAFGQLVYGTAEAVPLSKTWISAASEVVLLSEAWIFSSL